MFLFFQQFEAENVLILFLNSGKPSSDGEQILKEIRQYQCILHSTVFVTVGVY